MIKLGIIGSGFGLYGLLPAFHSLPNCRVAAFCGRPSPRLLNSISETTRLYQSWHEMLASEPLDALAIATPPSAQYQIATVALDKGMHVFAEKPLTAQLIQAYDLVDRALHSQVTHGIDFLFPEIDVWQTAKKMLDDKRFGEICKIVVNWDFRSHAIRHKISSWKTDSSLGGGALSFYFSHALHYLEYFMGTIKSLRSRFNYSADSLNGGEVGVDVDVEFVGGAVGTAHISCDSEPMRHALIFTCQFGQIILENQQSITEHFLLKTRDHHGHETLIPSRDFTPDKGPDKDERVIIVKRLAKRFIDSCLQRQQMKPSFLEGLRVQELIEQMNLSH